MLPTLVLAAGLGSRLDPLTRTLAKAALPLAGRTLIERQLDWLAREGCRDIVFVHTGGIFGLFAQREPLTGVLRGAG